MDCTQPFIKLLVWFVLYRLLRHRHAVSLNNLKDQAWQSITVRKRFYLDCTWRRERRPLMGCSQSDGSWKHLVLLSRQKLFVFGKCQKLFVLGKYVTFILLTLIENISIAFAFTAPSSFMSLSIYFQFMELLRCDSWWIQW